jgi:DNA-binding NarL/FixJ family response regulator
LKPIRIAIADDHAVVCEGYRRLIELEDDMRVVATFPTGERAYQWLTHHDADVLILDIAMPGRGGLDTLKRLRCRCPDLQIMIFTMHESESLQAHAAHLGAARFISKCSPPEVLVESVREVARADRSKTVELDDESAYDAESPQSLFSPREFDIFILLAEGVPVEEIAERRELSIKTVWNYQTSIRHKTGCRNPIEIHRYAQRFKLLGANPE